MLQRRFLLLICSLTLFSAPVTAQKLDASFEMGGTAFTSDAQAQVPGTCLPSPCKFPTTRFITGNDIYFAGTLALRLLNVHLISFHLEVPVVAAPSAALTEINKAGGKFEGGKISSLYVTPSLRLKFAPGAPLSPFASVGGGWARYKINSFDSSINKAALQFGGGVDIKTRFPLLGFRAEVRDFVTDQPDFVAFSLQPPGSQTISSHRHNVLVGAGVVLHF
jgi:hypothetical protein